MWFAAAFEVSNFAGFGLPHTVAPGKIPRQFRCIILPTLVAIGLNPLTKLSYFFLSSFYNIAVFKVNFQLYYTNFESLPP